MTWIRLTASSARKGKPDRLTDVPRKKLRIGVWSCLLCASLLTNVVFADEEEVLSGLAAEYQDSSHSIRRIDQTLSFDWSRGAPDPRIGRPFSAEWSGQLLIRQPGNHTFHVSLTGEAELLIDDRSVLKAAGDGIFYSGQPVSLNAGDHRILVKYRSGPFSESAFQAFWSSPDFTLEPLPSDVLTIDPKETDRLTSEPGRVLTESLRCSACHQGLAEQPTLRAPDLTFLRDLSAAAVIQQLSATENRTGNMPVFRFSPSEVLQVAAFLKSQSRDPVPQNREPKLRDGDAAAGEKLLQTVGCAVCHQLPGEVQAAEQSRKPFSGPSLRGLFGRRSFSWLLKWLEHPESLNPDHRMPVFTLTDDERRQITVALMHQDSTRKPEHPQPIPDDTDSIEAGRKLVISSGCVNCHTIAGIEPRPAALPRPALVQGAFSENNCLSDRPAGEPGGGRVPQYTLDEHERAAVHAWIGSVPRDLPKADGSRLGQLLMERNGCLGCHDRNQQKGLSAIAAKAERAREDLRGQSQALIPPALTAVGDRLRDDVLESAVTGKNSPRRLPWLLVRMPDFGFSRSDMEAIRKFLVASDRIPDSADPARQELFEHLNPHHPAVAAPEDLLNGNRLAGAAGFNCIACHKAGAFEPRNVAMGTRGSDLLLFGQRLRARYFLRWMQNPIRIVSGVEMPALRKPVTGLLEESLSRQIATLWLALSDPHFAPPTVISRYEQLVTVHSGDRPQVIRDVFTIGEEKDRDGVARAFAIGFGNGHNLLFDLDTLTLRQWTIGEFARQRTEGKSWFWSMAGIPVLNEHPAVPFCQAVPEGDNINSALNPVPDQQRIAELLSWHRGQDSTGLRVRLHFDSRNDSSAESSAVDQGLSPHSDVTAWNHPNRPMSPVLLRLEWTPVGSDSGATGWKQSVTVESAPAGWGIQIPGWKSGQSEDSIPWHCQIRCNDTETDDVLLTLGQSAERICTTPVHPVNLVPPVVPPPQNQRDRITVVPGFSGERAPLRADIMPTAFAWRDSTLILTSLKGQVWFGTDADQDGLPESLAKFAEGLAAPYGIQVDGDSLLVAHKPEVIRLRDSDADGTADQFDVVASGWGYSDDYHDWTTSLARGPDGAFYAGLGSDYSQNKRPENNDRWRGTILKIDSSGSVSPIAYSFRFPMGLAFDHRGNLFVTDNQGVQNTFNEINHVIPGRHYGVPSRHETPSVPQAETPALMVPHPWTRSVNSIVFLPDNFRHPKLAGHGIGCEYDTRCLIRFTVQDVGGTLQGACYRFSLPDQPAGGQNFTGPICSAVGPDGSLYIGSIWDSGWQGGSNTGCIERLVPEGSLPNGIREIRAVSDGFEVQFFSAVDARQVENPAHWTVQSFTRVWEGSYATPDTDRQTSVIKTAELLDDQETVRLHVHPLKAGYLYEIAVQPLNEQPLWPSEGYYSMKVVPEK